MNRFSSLLLMLVSLLLSTSAVAEADGPDWWSVHGVADDDVLNLRASGSPHAAKVGEIPPNASCVRNMGCKGGLTLDEYTRLSEPDRKALARKRPRWCQVEFQGTIGWVSGHYLREGSCVLQGALGE